MLATDLKSLTWMSHSLWADPERARYAALTAVEAMALLDADEERGAIRCVSALWERVRAEPEGNAVALNHPFYRLYPEERLVLAALHLGRWSYGRLGRALGIDPETVGRLAVSARQMLLAQDPARAKSSSLGVAGSLTRTVECPEFVPELQWTHRFLDEELEKQERFFLERHLAGCRSCVEALDRARALYHEVRAQLPFIPGDDWVSARASELDRAFRRMRKLAHPRHLTTLESLLLHLSRPSTQRFLIAGIVLIVLAWVAR